MRKVILTLATVLLVMSVISCAQKPKYSVAEVGGVSDNGSGAAHKQEVLLEKKEYQKIKAEPTKEITMGDRTYTGNYWESRKGYLYHDDADYYQRYEDGGMVEFAINNQTGRTDRFSYLEPHYVENKANAPRLDRDACLKTAQEYLGQLTSSADDYTLTKERYLEIPEYEVLYIFKFVRVIDGMETSDSAFIEVSIFGDVVSYSLINFEEMKGAKLPSEEDMNTIREMADEKLASIYEAVQDKYTYSVQSVTSVFMRLQNGKYAIKYRYSIDLTPKNGGRSIADVTELLVNIE